MDLPAIPAIPMPALIGLSVALGLGLLIGAERERRKGSGSQRAPAGIRTFAAASVVGAVAVLLGGGLILAMALLCIGALTLMAYQRSRSDDPGLTTEISLLLTTLLGGLAMREALLAAGLGVILAILLAARERLHHFVRGVLIERELGDLLLFAAAVLIALPLAPDRNIGPFQAINPHTLVLLIVLIMAINAMGYIASRLLGARYGLPVAGLFGGFVSSTATIHAMGTRIRRDEHSTPSLVQGATAGAVLSSVATLIQLLLVLWLMARDLAELLLIPMCVGVLVSVAYSIFFVRRALVGASDVDEKSAATSVEGRAFDPIATLGFISIVAAMMVIVGALNTWLDARGVLLSAAIGGLVDAHAAAAAVATAFTRNSISLEMASVCVLAGMTSNAAMKMLVAYQAGGVSYFVRIAPGIGLMVAAVWVMAWLGN